MGWVYLLKKKEINFKIWLLVASLDEENNIIIKQASKENFFYWGNKSTNAPKNKAELDQFMPGLMKCISEVLYEWKTPTRAETTPHCISVTNKDKGYNLNIVFRTNMKLFKIEALFNKEHSEYYKNQVKNSWTSIIESLADVSIHDYINMY